MLLNQPCFVALHITLENTVVSFGGQRNDKRKRKFWAWPIQTNPISTHSIFHVRDSIRRQRPHHLGTRFLDAVILSARTNRAERTQFRLTYINRAGVRVTLPFSPFACYRKLINLKGDNLFRILPAIRHIRHVR